MLESKIEEYFIEKVGDLGAWCIKFTPQGLRGMPDRIILLPGGKTFFVELKAPGKKTRALQDYQIGKLKGYGFHVYVIDNLEQIEVFIEEVTGDYL